jgi:hypothetical protein
MRQTKERRRGGDERKGMKKEVPKPPSDFRRKSGI